MNDVVLPLWEAASVKDRVVGVWSDATRLTSHLRSTLNRWAALRMSGAVIAICLSKSLQVYGLPFFLRRTVDELTHGDRSALGTVLWAVVGYAAARLSGPVFDNVAIALFERIGQTIVARVAANVFKHILTLSLRFHLDRRTGAVTKILERGSRSLDTMLHFMMFNIAPTLIELSMVAEVFGTRFGTWLVAVTLVMVVAYVGLTCVMTDRRNRLRERMNELNTGSLAQAVDSLLNFETVKYFSAEDREVQRYREGVASYATTATQSQKSLAWLNVGQNFISNLTLAVGMAIVSWGWAEHRFSPGDVMAVSMLLSQLFRPLDLLGLVYRAIGQGLADVKEMFKLLETVPEIGDRECAQPLAPDSGAVRFEHVGFAYVSGRKVLRDIDLTIAEGKTLAVVGASGAGKSTLGRLLFRFYDVTQGRITIGNQDVRDVTQESLRRAIGIVPQDTILFNDTIGYNIAYGLECATQDQIEDAARGAALHDFVTSLPDGYNTCVGERGLKLSGGERQRIAIARTLLKAPKLLILDEATGSLDSLTETEVQKTLAGMTAGRTTLIIAHRLSTIARADEIVVLDGGRIVERGTHPKLLALNGAYAEMWSRQQKTSSEATEQRNAA